MTIKKTLFLLASLSMLYNPSSFGEEYGYPVCYYNAERCGVNQLIFKSDLNTACAKYSPFTALQLGDEFYKGRSDCATWVWPYNKEKLKYLICQRDEKTQCIAGFESCGVYKSLEFDVNIKNPEKLERCSKLQAREKLAANIFNGISSVNLVKNDFGISLTSCLNSDKLSFSEENENKPITALNEAVWRFDGIQNECHINFRAEFCAEAKKHLTLSYWNADWVKKNLNNETSKKRSLEAYCPDIQIK